jgi:uracil-DNA glycosylase
MTSAEFKQQLLNKLYAPYKNCHDFPLYTNGATQIVFGEGNPNAKIMLIGEAPGRDEDRLGRPFVGRSGQLLTQALKQAGLEREDVFITNVVKCRPPDNRTPTPQEIESYTNLILISEIKIIRPRVILLLGSVALQALLKTNGISKLRGTIQHYDGITVIPTYHPAYVLRNSASLTTFCQDIQLAKQCATKE